MYNIQRKASKVTVVTADYTTVPWEEADKIWKDAADTAEATALVEHNQAYAKFISRKEDEYNAVNEAPYEGNFSDEYPFPPLPDRVDIRRKAGNKALITDFIPRFGINQWGQQYLSQIVIMISKLRLVTMNGEDHMLSGEYYRQSVKDCCVSPEELGGDMLSAKGFLNKHFMTPRMKGIYRFLMLDAKSSYLPKQYTGDARNYCALVPMIMFAHKYAGSIPYNNWDRSEVHTIMPHELYKAATCRLPDIDKEDLLQLRDEGLLWRTGTKKGTLRNPEYTHTLYGIQDSALKEVPELARVMMTQIWCAHPSNRTNYMILDPDNWDGVPPSLIAPEVTFDPKPQVLSNLPWLD